MFDSDSVSQFEGSSRDECPWLLAMHVVGKAVALKTSACFYRVNTPLIDIPLLSKFLECRHFESAPLVNIRSLEICGGQGIGFAQNLDDESFELKHANLRTRKTFETLMKIPGLKDLRLRVRSQFVGDLTAGGNYEWRHISPIIFDLLEKRINIKVTAFLRLTFCEDTGNWCVNTQDWTALFVAGRRIPEAAGHQSWVDSTRAKLLDHYQVYKAKQANKMSAKEKPAKEVEGDT